jgi:hypothetical protein
VIAHRWDYRATQIGFSAKSISKSAKAAHRFGQHEAKVVDLSFVARNAQFAAQNGARRHDVELEGIMGCEESWLAL